MTRSWVKKELKKEPLEAIVGKMIDYSKANKNNLLMGVAIVGIIGLFAGVIIKNKITENKQAVKMFAMAQNDFYRFNYKKAIKNFESIEKQYGSVEIMDQVIYLKGLCYYRQGDYEVAGRVFSGGIEKYKKSNIIMELRLSLGIVYEDLGEMDKALDQYGRIEDNHYLKPEAFAGMARVYESQNKIKEAINEYTKLQSHYVNTYWGNVATQRLAALGVGSEENKGYIPEIDIRQ
ncbi:tol-pal system YbgF family protein [Elusimicrobiota bacterium]